LERDFDVIQRVAAQSDDTGARNGEIVLESIAGRLIAPTKEQSVSLVEGALVALEDGQRFRLEIERHPIEQLPSDLRRSEDELPICRRQCDHGEEIEVFRRPKPPGSAAEHPRDAAGQLKSLLDRHIAACSLHVTLESRRPRSPADPRRSVR
jgi:hypothetical protein